MSRAKVVRDPNGAADCVFFIGKHYIHISSPFVASVTNKGFLTPLGRIARDLDPRNATGGGALGHERAGVRYGSLHWDDLQQRVDVERGTQPRARRIGVEPAAVFIRSEAAKAAMDELELSDERGCAGFIHAFPANRRRCRPNGRKRGLKLCR